MVIFYSYVKLPEGIYIIYMIVASETLIFHSSTNPKNILTVTTDLDRHLYLQLSAEA